MSIKIKKHSQATSIEFVIFGLLFRIGFVAWPWMLRDNWAYYTLAGQIIDHGWRGIIGWLFFLKRKQWKKYEAWHLRICCFAIAVGVPESVDCRFRIPTNCQDLLPKSALFEGNLPIAHIHFMMGFLGHGNVIQNRQ